MKKPPAALLKLAEICPITEMKINWRQTGTDEGDTFCYLKSRRGSVGGLWATYKEYLDVSVSSIGIARLEDRYRKKVVVYKAFVAANQEELKEYERLKKIYG